MPTNNYQVKASRAPVQRGKKGDAKTGTDWHPAEMLVWHRQPRPRLKFASPLLMIWESCHV